MTHPRAYYTAYTSWEEGREKYCTECESVDVETPCPVEEEHNIVEYDSDDFQNDLMWFTEQVQEMWPSLSKTDSWLDREVHVVLENSLVEVSVSEYCGLVALSVAPKEGYYADAEYPGLSQHWADQIKSRFMDKFSQYNRVGGFNDGTSLYEKAE
jgi:hypothetical protein